MINHFNYKYYLYKSTNSEILCFLGLGNNTKKKRKEKKFLGYYLCKEHKFTKK